MAIKWLLLLGLLMLLQLLLLPNTFAIENGNNNRKFGGRTVTTMDPQHGTENNPQEECKDTSWLDINWGVKKELEKWVWLTWGTYKNQGDTQTDGTWDGNPPGW